MKKTLTAIALCAFCSFHAQTAVAGFEPHNWQVRLRAIDVSPQESSSGTIPGEAKAGNAIMPEVDISYFFNDNFSLELILATSRHEIGWTPAINLGDVWVLPPTLTAQYHFMTDQQFSPYLGAGINYTIFYNSDPGAFNSVEYKNSFGYALQLGADYKLDQHWMLNADIKKIFLDTEVSVNNGAVRADVNLDPWVFGLGVGYRF